MSQKPVNPFTLVGGGSSSIAFSNHKMTLFPIQDKVSLLTPLEHFIKVCQAILDFFAINGEIIHEHLHNLLNQVREYRHHAPLK
jgi:hypothetical protein